MKVITNKHVQRKKTHFRGIYLQKFIFVQQILKYIIHVFLW